MTRPTHTPAGHRLVRLAILLSAFCGAGRASAAAAGEPVSGWPAQVQPVQYESTGDRSQQPALFYKPPAGGDAAVPLLVGLHSWSGDYLQPERAYADWCIKNGWAFIHPHFRGPNERPEACGSELVVADVLSAVAYARREVNVDPDRIYLVGVSGGGYAALLMAGRAPDIWAGVSAWASIYDLTAWHDESRRRKGSKYADMIEKSCGGAPGAGDAIDAEYRRRSPSGWLAKATGVPLDINTGIHDGHKGSVPVSHSLNAFDALAAPGDRIAAADIDRMVQDEAIPQSLRRPLDDPLYHRLPALLRRVSGNARVTVFDGGHAILPEAALPWLARQRRGHKAVWDVPASARGDVPAGAPGAGN